MKKCAAAVTGARRGEGHRVPGIGASTIGTYLPSRATSLTDIWWGRKSATMESMGGITPPADENVANYVYRLSYLTAEEESH